MWYWYSLAWFIGFGMGGLFMQHLYLVALKHESNKRKAIIEKDRSDIYKLLLNQENIDTTKTVESLEKSINDNF